MPVAKNEVVIGGDAVGRPTSGPSRNYWEGISVKKGENTVQIEAVSLVMEKGYNTDKEVPKLQIRARLLHPKQDPTKGHGAVFFTSFTPTITRASETTKESNLHRFLRVLMNEDGSPLSDKQIFGAENVPESRKRQLANDRLIEFLNDLERRKAQIQITIQYKNGKPRWTETLGFTPEDELLPEYTPPPRVADPREANDDPSLTCSVTGEVIHGWENREGEWISNVEWVNKQLEFFGPDFLYEFEGKHYPAPFGPRHYRKAREQRQAMAQSSNEPF